MAVSMPMTADDVRSTAPSRAAAPRSFWPAGMASILGYLRRLPDDFPDDLSAASPQRRRYPFRPWLLLGLMLLCVIPRGLLAMRVEGLCPDGVFYIRLAEALDQGRYRQAFEDMNLNVYPVALMVLHRLGLNWETAGLVWSLAVSTLVTLPLFGWARRQFDDAVAATACLLYAVHPVFIQWSPELIRDPTFWLFFTVFLYLFWRAAIEIRPSLFLAAGLALTLAVMTRFEGLFLFIPLILWTFWRIRAVKTSRLKAKIYFGAALSILVFPILLLLVNFIWLRRHSDWLSTRMAPFTLIYDCWCKMGLPAPGSLFGAASPTTPGISFSRITAIFVPALVKGVSPAFGLLMLGGIWRWRRVWKRRDHQPLFYTALIVMAAAWIHASCAEESCDRYFLPIAIMASVFAALGLLALSRRFLLFADALQFAENKRMAMIFAPAAIVLFISVGSAFFVSYASRRAEVELAAWIHGHYVSPAMLLGSEGTTSVVAYYAGANWDTLGRKMDQQTALETARRVHPDVILLVATHFRDGPETERLARRIEELGFNKEDKNSLSCELEEEMVVLTKF